MQKDRTDRKGGWHRALREFVGRLLRRGSGRSFQRWRLANLALACMVTLLGIVLVCSSVFGSRPASWTMPVPASDSAAGLAKEGRQPISEYRKWFQGRKLFVRAGPTAAGRELGDAVQKAKDRLGLRGIAEVAGKMGAYFEVDEGGGGKSFGVYFEGDRVGDFTVASVEPAKVLLDIAEQSVTFSLETWGGEKGK